VSALLARDTLHLMDNEPVFEKSIRLPMGYAFTARARPLTVKRTVIKLLPWALYAALPPGRVARIALFAATRVSPMMKQKIK
jgi:hypothetical protein